MKFRQKSNPEAKTITTNLAGGIAHIQSPELELVSLLLTSFVEDQYYRKSSDQLTRLQELITAIPDKKFIAQSLIYARNEFGMRSITHAGAVELLKYAKGQQWGKNAIAKIIKRPDDMLEMVGYWMSTKAGTHAKVGLPSVLRKGISLALEKFDGYQLAKYKSTKSDVKLVDIFNLVHPKPSNPERAELYKQLMKGELKNTATWESKLSLAGQHGETEEEIDSLKGQAWKELLTTKRIGYFALLKNLRNIIEQSPESVHLACAMLREEHLIKKSLVLPFRYLTACDALQELAKTNTAVIPLINQVLIAINDAMVISCNNAPRFDGLSLIAVDTSGSMQGKLLDIGALFAGVFTKANPNSIMMVFSDRAQYVTLNPNDSLATLVHIIKHNNLNGGTDFHSIFNNLRIKYDRIIILSDMQGWIGAQSPSKTFATYKKTYNCNPYVYSIDLQGQGTMQLPEKNVFAVAGFSDKIFDTIKMLEQDKNALINKIKTIEI